MSIARPVALPVADWALPVAGVNVAWLKLPPESSVNLSVPS
jgi:hypothetical protein